MIISQKNIISQESIKNKIKVYIDFDWYEVNKRIQQKIARNGQVFRFKFLKENPNFKNEEIIYSDDKSYYVVSIIPCECIVIKPKNSFEIASVCYEIGNKHLPLFYEQEELLVSFEKPLFAQLQALGFEVSKQERSLLTPLKTTVAPHGGKSSLFTKIMNLTQST